MHRATSTSAADGARSSRPAHSPRTTPRPGNCAATSGPGRNDGPPTATRTLLSQPSPTAFATHTPAGTPTPCADGWRSRRPPGSAGRTADPPPENLRNRPCAAEVPGDRVTAPEPAADAAREVQPHP